MALVISTVIAIAALSALTVSQRGFSTVDAASQLRDNSRFAIDLLQRIGVQSGYRDLNYAAAERALNVVGVDANPFPNVFGVDNATPSASDPANTFIPRTVGVGFGSDILQMRYQTTETFPGSGVSDRTTIDCAGVTDNTISTERDNRMTNIIHVGLSQGEPSLMCTTVNAALVIGTAQPIVRGVENFQVVYGVDGVVPSTAPVPLTTDGIADRYLRADQLTVPGNPIATNQNWRRVRSIRIGMVMRGSLGTTQGAVAQTYYPLGQGKDSASGTKGSAFALAADVGTEFTPPTDSRLRQVVTFTIHLRNAQEL